MSAGSEHTVSQFDRLLRVVLDHTHIMAVYLDPHFNFIWVNRAYAETCGHDPSFFPGKNHFRLYPHAENQLIFQRVVASGEPFFVAAKPFEFPDQPERGVTYWDWSLIPVKDADANVAGLVFTLVDVTERVRTEVALQAAYHYSRNLIESSLDPMATISPEGRITDLNLATERITGVPRDKLIGSDFANYFTEPDLARAGYQKVFAQGQVVDYPLAIRHASGHITDVLYNASVYRSQLGEVLGVFAVARDITERKRAEEVKEQLKAQNRLLQKAESLNRMAGAVAHHFNNQLQGVMMNLELALLDLPRPSTQVDNLAAALQATRKAAEVSSQMLTYLGQTAAKLEPLALAQICRQSLSLLQAALPQDVGLETRLLTPGPSVHANANQIQQVLTNLVRNAQESGAKGPQAIRVSVDTAAAQDIPARNRFPIDWQPASDIYARLEVADRGCGIPEHDIENLFDPFFSTKFPGRGLGLAVVLGIVRCHRGAVTVESTPGRGSIFRVFLPALARDLSSQAAPQVAPAAIAGGATLLVVDDEPIVRNSVARALKLLGFTVLLAQDGAEAVALFEQHRKEIRCVLCDLTMPRMNGWQTLSALRAIASNVPVILASGFSEAQALSGDHPDRPQAFLSKPYDFETLRQTLSRVLANRTD